MIDSLRPHGLQHTRLSCPSPTPRACSYRSRDIALLTKVHLIKAMVFPGVICESWTIEKAERQRTDAFKLWCWWRLLRVHWTAKRSNQSILKEINPECSLEGLMLKLKLQYFGHIFGEELIHWKRPWCWERLRAGGEGDDRGREGWMASLTGCTWVWASSRSWWWTGKPGMLQSMGSQRVRHNWVTELKVSDSFRNGLLTFWWGNWLLLSFTPSLN